jgi:hypothetical protein
MLVVHLKRRCQRSVEDLDLLREHLDLPAHQVGIDGTFGPVAHASHDPQHEFAAHLVGGLERDRRVGVAHDLHQTLAIAQVDKDDPP